MKIDLELRWLLSAITLVKINPHTKSRSSRKQFDHFATFGHYPYNLLFLSYYFTNSNITIFSILIWKLWYIKPAPTNIQCCYIESWWPMPRQSDFFWLIMMTIVFVSNKAHSVLLFHKSVSFNSPTFLSPCALRPKCSVCLVSPAPPVAAGLQERGS